MPFGFHKKDKEKESHFPDVPEHHLQSQPAPPGPPPPEFRMYRSDTTTQEEIFAPAPAIVAEEKAQEKAQKKEKDRKRLSFLRRSSSAGVSSDHVPSDLVSPTAEAGKEQEDKWEWRASQLGLGANTGVTSPISRSASPSVSQGTDKDIQEAIRLHEGGDLEGSTKLFKRLADPAGANNPLSQVLYGLALRHGWGCESNSTEAIKYLQAAAANSASIEQEALRAGMKKGGAAKGELVLAIFELGNCFRHGWGTEKDPVAAFNYYQTAANLGDTDAMNETGWCYLNGYGMKKKDKYLSAKYYRLAEENGNKIVGNSWIYKDKYVNPPTK
ncbi:hypothetical protein ABW20_dc0105626 [Dactylellina cionopaga]|nr:hypothetical protein ABW20_dc0105626 [Dactylellina cionopaga]